MDYKYTIHITEDIGQHVTTVRKLLGFDYSNQSSDKEKIKLCDEWFTFIRFKHPGEAYKYYDQTGLIPDLKIQDLDFTEVTAKNVPAQFRENISGIREIEYLLKKCELLKRNPRMAQFIIPFSGKLDSQYILAALQKYGWEKETMEKVKEIADTRLMKDDQARLKLRLVEKLKDLAQHYFQNLDGGERNRLMATAAGGVHANWKHFNVKFERFDFPLRKMLVGFGDIERMTPKEISDIVTTLLADSLVKIKFNGINWTTGGECYVALQEYLADIKQYPHSKRVINLRALDILMDLIRMHDEFGFNSGEELALFERNKLYKIGTHSRKYEWKKIYQDKLTARRVLVSLSELYDFDSDELFNICMLISKGNTEYLISKTTTSTKSKRNNDGLAVDKRNFITNTITKDLGLFRADNNIAIDDEKILGEEMAFIQSYVTDGIAMGLRKFLDNYFPPNKIIPSNSALLGEFFLDLTAFNEFLYAVEKQDPEKIQPLVQDIKAFFGKDKSYDSVGRILGLSNPLFL